MAPKFHDVVISGVSGIFPECDSIDELEMKLLNKENLITLDDRKWVPGELDVPAATGKFKNIVSLDDMFFGINKKLFEIMDPMTTLCLKHSFEAIFDAGINPLELSGSDTAVIMTSVTSETEYECVINNRYLGHALIGQSRTMQANRISYFLNTRGPSLVIDASWNSGMQALVEAHTLISKGIASSALVGACNILFGPEVSFHYKAMGKLNEDGKTKSFSVDADGYTRSESCVVLYLQRAEDAKRSYGTLMSVLSKNYGERPSSYPDFSPEFYEDMLKESYKNAGIDPSDVAYIEADGSASKKADEQELNSISGVMCKNRKTALPVGSVKSNVGHTEGASSLVSIVKALIALRSGVIPPNMHYNAPNPHVSALVNGQIQVVTEPTPLNGNVVGISSVAISGTYGHAVIKQNPKVKKENEQKTSDNFPWLFIISGREIHSLTNIIEKVSTMPFDEELISLTHSIFKTDIRRHTVRGYTILNTNSHQNHEIKQYDGAEKRPIWFLFSGMGSQWRKMGIDLMRLPVFAKAIHLCHDILLPKGLNLLEILNSDDPQIFDSILNAFVGIAAIQIGLVDVLKELGVEPDGLIGHSVGELGCAYADGCFTAEQMILSAWARGTASNEAKLIKGMMAAVGMGYNQIKDDIPDSIDVACHNSDTNCTLSGPVDDMERYIDSLKKRGIFAKLVNAANIAYHSKYIKPAAPVLLKYLKEVIPEPKARSKRWVSSSIPESCWDNDLAKFSSAEYHTNNLLSSVLFEEASAHIPERAIVIEIAPHGLLQSIVKKSLPKCTNIPLINRFEKDTLKHLFQAIGKMYLEGINVNLSNLYPKCEYPVSRNVPSLCQFISWDNIKADMIISFMLSRSNVLANPSWGNIKLTDERFQNYLGNKILNKQVIPPSALLWLVMEIFENVNQDKSGPIVLENVHITTHQITNDISNSQIDILISKGCGDFEIDLKSSTNYNLSSGSIRFLSYGENVDFEPKGKLINQPILELSHDDIYKFFEECSLVFNESFKLIENISFDETDLHATVIWKEQWVEFLDALMMVLSFYHTVVNSQLMLITSVRYLCIDASYFEGYNFKEVEVYYNKSTNTLSCEGLMMHLPLVQPSNLITTVPQLIRETCQFLPYTRNTQNYTNIEDCMQIVVRNVINYEINPNELKVIESDYNLELNREMKRILNSFNIVNEIEIVSPSEDAINDHYLNLKKTDNILIVGGINYKRTFKCLKKVRSGFLILKENEVIENIPQLYPLQKFKFSDELFTLYKVNFEEKTTNIINVDQNGWKEILNAYLQKEAKSNSPKTIHLLRKLNSLSGIYKFLKYCLSLENSYLIRFIFLDDQSPPFSLDNKFYMEQLKIDLVMNVCRNGLWGCLKLLTTPLKSKIYSTNDEHYSLYPLSYIKGEKTRLKYLGMNLQQDCPDNKELGPFDYCSTNKHGETIIGIGRLSDDKRLIEDDYLWWRKPNDWSDEDAVSVPVCYAIAYYILEVRKGKIKQKNILIHRGNLLISQAIINVALAMGWEVFTTYDTPQDKIKIKQLYPMIKDDHIYGCKRNMFDYEILMRNEKIFENPKMNVIVNTSNDIAVFDASLKCLEHSGILFHLNTEIMRSPYTMGLLNFEIELNLITLSCDNLLDYSLIEKEWLKKAMENGLAKGQIKPLSTKSVPKTILKTDIVDLLKNNDNKLTKLITRIDGGREYNIDENVFICSPNKSYIIHGYDDISWFDLLSWLVSRGAQEVHVIVDEDKLIHSASHRLNSILNNYPSVKIHLISKKKIKDKHDMKAFLSAVNITKEISGIFLIGQDFDEDANLMDSVLRELRYMCKLVCIGTGGEIVCEQRSKKGLPALAISCQKHLLKSSVYLPEIEYFINKNLNNPVIFLNEGVNINNKDNENSMDSRQRLPEDITELLALSSKTASKACFIEQIASCPKHKHNREVSPIFTIPSLRPNEMNDFTSKLFYPTYEARIPYGIDDIEITAKQLHQDLKRFHFNIFTIIANDWGGALGISLAKRLEADGKTVLLVMLDSAPQTVQSWVSSVLLMEINLINKYIKIPYKIKKQLPSLPNWNEKLTLALKYAMIEDSLKYDIREGLNHLRNCLISVMKYKPNGKKYQGKCFLYCNKNGQNECGLNEYCENKPEIFISDDRNHQDMLNNPEIVKKINGIIPFEYKTAARDLGNTNFGLNVLTDCRFRTGGLERA